MCIRDSLEIEGKYNPDFVIHRQGSMESNEVVVEVTCNFNKAGIKKDFRTLKKMMKCGKYKIGVFVLIGYDMNCFKEKIFSEMCIRDRSRGASPILERAALQMSSADGVSG